MTQCHAQYLRGQYYHNITYFFQHVNCTTKCQNTKCLVKYGYYHVCLIIHQDELNYATGPFESGMTALCLES